ncbi:DNA-binding response regulator [Pseudanabaena sp. SR411]|jgi:DNA-binding response OmpR family regulator|uniref:two-component system response regulator RppA n=1 Tax=Pseudanabaena sp. SR411 TaxID=1980935 RepID=UPI000B9939FE|nr:two-component system response regulator RppA [Pseudanabaena sp. SR411]OYQ66466.1 DNA-binding response regulator [Pseudanabaena sp. SR411]
MRVLLVEDEIDLGMAIQRSLKQEKYIVDWVQDGREAWDYLDRQPTEYTVAILDWMLPQLSGLELCKRLRKNQNPLPVIILTAKDRIEDRVQGLDAGADDYLVKPFGMLELLARLRALQRRSPQIQATQLKVANLVLDYNTCTIAAHDINGKYQIIQLTAKEFQLLEYFMQHPHQILTRDQILSRLWEMQAEPESNVVAAQIRLLRRRLAEYGQEKLIETVYGLGYRFNVN